MSFAQQKNGIRPCRDRKSPLVEEEKAIQAMVASRLQHSGYVELRDISCHFHEGVLTLRGCVSSYYMKQLAQTLVLHLEGVQELNNRVEVLVSLPP